MKISYLLPLVALAACICMADDQRTLLITEQEYVTELLSLDKPALAQQHLDIMKREFPKEAKDINYYQGHISFRLKKFRDAIDAFEALMKLKPTPAREQESRKYLTLAYIRTGKFDEATKMLNTIKAFGARDSWYAAACVELAETQGETIAYKPAKKRVELKTDTQKLLATFAKKYPKHEKIAWIRFFMAEYEYDKLIALLYDLGKTQHEASPEVLQQKNRAIILQLHKARKIYEAIKEATPHSPVMARVKPRLRYLAQVIDKLKKGESFLPES